MLREHFKFFLSLPTSHIVGKMHMSSKCTQHVITGFQAPLPPVSTCLPSSGFQLAQGSPVSVQMMLDPLVGPQENTYMDGVPTDDLTQGLDCHTKMVYVEHVQEQNWEEMARYANSGPESD